MMKKLGVNSSCVSFRRGHNFLGEKWMVSFMPNPMRKHICAFVQNGWWNRPQTGQLHCSLVFFTALTSDSFKQRKTKFPFQNKNIGDKRHSLTSEWIGPIYLSYKVRIKSKKKLFHVVAYPFYIEEAFWLFCKLELGLE